MRVVVLLAGIVVLLGTANSVLTVLIVPRPATSLVVYRRVLGVHPGLHPQSR